jgi:hypothetical protein
MKRNGQLPCRRGPVKTKARAPDIRDLHDGLRDWTVGDAKLRA